MSSCYRTVFTPWLIVTGLVASSFPSAAAAAGSWQLYRSGEPQAHLVSPDLTGPSSQIVTSTINGYLKQFYGWEFPLAQDAAQPGTYVVVGSPKNNAVLRRLVAAGLELSTAELGEEGFTILTYERDDRRFLIVSAETPAGLKHGCQELVFYQIAATGDSASVPWPINVTMQPEVAYRGCYTLPCWSAYDSLESWRRVLQFQSELTLNRTWFWLNGFPLLPQYGGLYQDTDLARLDNVRELIQLCHREELKFYIGGGWFTWHHKESASGSQAERVARVGAGGGETPLAADEEMLNNGVQYYLDLLTALPEADGVYLEPTGEGAEAGGEVWRHHVEALDRLLQAIDRTRTGAEVAIAIGRFNSSDYRRAIQQLGPPQPYWFWAWGNPVDDQALNEHPRVLRWHTTLAMSPFHGSPQPPQPDEAMLTGMVTSWDPGMGFGNPWNGWAKIGIDHPRHFHPYTMPYFSHQYWFRERCWNLNLTEEQFAARLAKRLFDADMPADSINLYLQLAAWCPTPELADRDSLANIEAFVKRYAEQGTLRNRDSLARMQAALAGIHRVTANKTRSNE